MNRQTLALSIEQELLEEAHAVAVLDAQDHVIGLVREVGVVFREQAVLAP